MPIMDYKQQAQADLKRLYSDKKISDKNKKDFEKFLDSRDVSPARVGIIARHIKLLFYELPDVVGTMKDRELMNKTFKKLQDKIKPGYYETVKNVGKSFVRWHNKNKTPDGWLDIKSNGKDGQKRDLKRQDMITWEDGLKIAEQTNSVQLKAIIMTQLDGGFRPSEFTDLNYGDVEIKKTFAVARVSGKTGKRDVILFKCVPMLQRWLKAHPYKKDNSPLWIIEYKNMSHRKKTDQDIRRYSYFAIQKRVRELGKQAQIKKPMDFYNLRHSACFLSKMDNVNPELAARKFGHTVDYYVNTYGRLDVEDDIKRYRRTYGLDTDKERKEEKTLECVKCGTVNEPGEVRCIQCHNPLTMDEALKSVDETQGLKEQLAQLTAMVYELKDLKAEQQRRKGK